MVGWLLDAGAVLFLVVVLSAAKSPAVVLTLMTGGTKHSTGARACVSIDVGNQEAAQCGMKMSTDGGITFLLRVLLLLVRGRREPCSGLAVGGWVGGPVLYCGCAVRYLLVTLLVAL